MEQKKNKDRVKEEGQPYIEPDPWADYPITEEERYEIIEGIRYDMKPAPVVNHQRILGVLHIMIHQTCHSNGVILFAPLDVYLDEDNLFQPDLVFILHEHTSIIKEKRIEGAPDLVAEILSPSTSQNDKIRKKRQYERFGVQEYWLIDPIHRTVDQFILEGQKYVLYETYGIRGRLTSPQFSCVDIDLNQLFAD